MDIYDQLKMLGGAAKRAEVARTAAQRREVSEALQAGRLCDLGAGWLATVDTAPAVMSARRLNATITCVSAAQFYRLTVLDHPGSGVHLAVPRARGSRPRPSRPRNQAIVHRESVWTRPTDVRVPLAPLDEVLTRVLRCLTTEAAVVTVDSALHQGLIAREELQRALRGRGSPQARATLALCDGRSRSATESLARLALRAAGLHVRAGVVIDGVGEVDLLVERWIVVECDGFAYHSGRREFREDRRRDRSLAAQGYVVLRFTYDEVRNSPGLVVDEVLRVLARVRDDRGWH